MYRFPIVTEGNIGSTLPALLFPVLSAEKVFLVLLGSAVCPINLRVLALINERPQLILENGSSRNERATAVQGELAPDMER